MYVNGQYGYGWYNPKYFDSNGVLRQDYEYLSLERRKETQQIATEVVKELAPKIAAEMFNQAIDNLIGALEYDIETCVHVAVGSFEEIYKSGKVEKLCSDAIIQELRKQIGKTDLKIKI